MAPQESLHVSCPSNHILSALGAYARVQAGPGLITRALKSSCAALSYLFVCTHRCQSNKNSLTQTKLFIFQQFIFLILSHLQVSQMRCPFLHWKIRVGGAISSKHT